MFTIKNNTEHEIIIKKSRFICYLKKVNTKDEIDLFINNIKEKHKNAKHCCYAYIINSAKKATDDKEPSGTAGIPMLNLLESKNLNHILAITIRYFGGIKLGTGGLYRAYTTVLKETIDLSELEEETIKYKYIIETNLDNSNILDKLKNVEIKNIIYTNIIKAELIATRIIDDDLTNLGIKIIDKKNFI